MMNHINHEQIPTDRRPLGYWLAAIEGPLRDNMRGVFAQFGVSRREWRVLTTLHNGPATLEEVKVALPPHRRPAEGQPERAGRSERPQRPGRVSRSIDEVLQGFVTRGWATLDRGSYALTAEGERIHDAVLTNVQTVRAQVTAGIADTDYATTMATLERIATNVGWKPGQRVMRGFGRRGPRG